MGWAVCARRARTGPHTPLLSKCRRHPSPHRAWASLGRHPVAIRPSRLRPRQETEDPRASQAPPQLKAKSLLLLNTKANRSPPPHSQNTFIALKTAFINKHTGERLRTRNTKMSNGAGHVRRALRGGRAGVRAPSIRPLSTCSGPVGASGLGQRGGRGAQQGTSAPRAPDSQSAKGNTCFPRRWGKSSLPQCDLETQSGGQRLNGEGAPGFPRSMPARQPGTGRGTAGLAWPLLRDVPLVW